MKIYYISIAILAVFFAVTPLSMLSAQTTSPATLDVVPGEEKNIFRIGFLEADTEPLLGESVFRRLGRHLEQVPDVQEALHAHNFSGIAVIPVDGFRDMVRRMNYNEFDLVFCSSTVYVRQDGDYSVILQIRRLRDIWDTRGGGKVLQKGALIISQRKWQSPGTTPPLPDDIAAYLQRARLAVVSSHSAPGYIFPMIKMQKDYGVTTPGSIIFSDSSEEVVKYVISGLADAGFCERGAVDDVIKNADVDIPPEQLVHIAFETEPIPTNPIVIKERYHPRNSELGRTIRNNIRAFFTRLLADMPRLEPSRDEYFTNLREVLSAFETIPK